MHIYVRTQNVREKLWGCGPVRRPCAAPNSVARRRRADQPGASFGRLGDLLVALLTGDAAAPLRCAGGAWLPPPSISSTVSSTTIGRSSIDGRRDRRFELAEPDGGWDASSEPDREALGDSMPSPVRAPPGERSPLAGLAMPRTMSSSEPPATIRGAQPAVAIARGELADGALAIPLACPGVREPPPPPPPMSSSSTASVHLCTGVGGDAPPAAAAAAAAPIALIDAPPPPPAPAIPAAADDDDDASPSPLEFAESS